MALMEITAVNLTGGAINLTRLGLTVPASGQLALTDYAYIHEIKTDETLYAAIVSSNIRLNVGSHTLTTPQSINWFINVSSELKYSVDALSDANIASLSGTTTIDAVVLSAGDRVLLTAQSTGAQNGIWVVQSGAWVRPNDFPTGGSAAGALIQVNRGTTYGNQLWSCTSDEGSDIIGTSTTSFSQITGSGGGGSLQSSYAAGNTITTGTGEGNLIIEGTELMQVTATGGLVVDSVFDFNGTAFTVDMSPSNGFTLNGTATSTLAVDSGDLQLSTTTSGSIFADAYTAIHLNSSNGSINIGDDADLGAINIATGVSARAVTVGNSTSGTTVNIEAADGITLTGNTSITGNLNVLGTTTSIDSTVVNIADNYLYLNKDYDIAAAVTGGIVVNYLPTATADAVGAGGFTAGVPSTSDATVATIGAATFSAGDIIQIAGAANDANNGLFEVISHAANVLTIRGQFIPTIEFFTQNNFATDSTASGDITKVTVSVIRTGTDGVWETGSGSATGIVYNNVATAASITLAQAYDGGNTITTDITNGDVVIAGTESVNITASNGLNLDTVFDFDGTLFDVLMSGSNGFSIDGTSNSNVSVTSADLTLSTITSGDLVLATAGIIYLDGLKFYGSSATAPTLPVPATGDRYYDTTLDMEMRYDGTRGKWLSVEAMYLQFGRNGSTNTGQYFRGIDGRVMSDTIGYAMPYNGTIVGIGYTRSDADTTNIEVVEGGVLAASITSSAASGTSSSLNANFSSGGIIAMKNMDSGIGANIIDDVAGWVKIKWRA